MSGPASACPYDTNGDGDCGRPLCPHCGPYAGSGPVPDPGVAAPRNVRAVMPDGTEVPLECTYDGWDGASHVWSAEWILPEGPARVIIDTLPARTHVQLRWRRSKSEDR